MSPLSIHGTPDGLGALETNKGIAVAMIVLPLLLLAYLATQNAKGSR